MPTDHANPAGLKVQQVPLIRLFMLAACFCWALYMLPILYATPNSDDYSAWVRVNSASGVLNSIVRMYYTWGGRWVGWALSGAIAAYVDFVNYYPHLLALNFLFSLLGWLCLVKAIWWKSVSWARAAGYAIILQLIFLSGSPDITETMYWVNGALNYTVGSAAAMSTLFCFRLYLLPDLQRYKRLFLALALLILNFTIAGFNSILGSLWVLVVAVICSAAFLERKPTRWYFVLFFLSALAGATIVFLAPGNYARAEHIPSSFNIGEAIPLLARSLWAWIPQWFLNPRLFCATGLFLIALDLPAEVPWAKRLGNKALPYLGLVWVAGLILAFSLPALAIGSRIPNRAVTVPYTFFICGWFFFLTLLRPHVQRQFPGREKLWTVLITLLVFSFFSTGNTRLIVDDLVTGSARRQHVFEQSRIETFLEAQRVGQKNVTISPMPRLSRVLPYYELSEEPGIWQNRVTAQFFGLDSISVVMPKEQQTPQLDPATPAARPVFSTSSISESPASAISESR